MKSKKNLYFLLPAVVFVWGFIIYRIVDFGEEEVGSQRVLPRITRVDTLDQPIYELKKNYTDPFLKHLAVSQNTTNTAPVQEPSTSPSVSANKETTDFQVVYKGFIIETGGRSKIALVTIDSQEVFLREREEYQSYMLLKIYADSVTMKKEDMQFSIAK